MNTKDKIFNYITFIMSLVPAILIAAIVIFLFYNSIPSIIYNGFTFFTSNFWYQGKEGTIVKVAGQLAQSDSSFGVLPLIGGTLITSALALLIALPFSYFVTLSIQFYMPKRIKKFLISLIELFAGIPSVVYGFWGILFLAPILYHNVEPWMSTNLSKIPLIGGFFAGEVLYGYGIIISAVILSVMIIPIITSVMTNSIESAPKEVKDGIYSLGATRWELGKYLLNNHSKASTYGGTLLGLGRALGETMAVLMVSGSLANAWPTNIYSAINTMAAFVASTLDSAFTDLTGMTTAALAELSLVLMAISLLASVAGRKIAGRGALRGYQSD